MITLLVLTHLPTIRLNAEDIKQKLELYEMGKMTLNELSDDSENCQGLMDYYFSHTNEISVRSKLPISRCFVAYGEYHQAIKLALDYVQVYSNDWHAWKILGGANLSLGNFDTAINYLTNSARLGDENSYIPLSFAALKIDRLDIVSNLVPHLLILKNEKPPPETKPLDLVLILSLYGVNGDQQEIFLKALDGVTAKQILSREDLANIVKFGCEQFKGENIQKIARSLEVLTNSIK